MPGLGTLRHAVRSLGRSPMFALTSILSLAIGIAASSTIFSMADALFLRPRPGLADESRLVDVGRATEGRGFDNFGYQLASSSPCRRVPGSSRGWPATGSAQAR
ncbi:MAG: hypothetical protein R2712_25595 [Vicinamibacterales bacterium]